MTRRFLVVTAAVGAIGLVSAEPAAGDLPGTGAVGEWAVGGFFDGLAQWVASGLEAVLDGLLAFLGQVSTPEPTAVWFSGPGSPYAAVRQVAAALLVGFVLLGVISGLLAGDPGAMVRRMLLGVPTAVLAIAAITVVATKLLALTDALSAAVLGPSLAGSAAPLSQLMTAAVAATSGAAGVVVGAIGVLAALAVWVELLVRSALVYVLVALSPLAFAASVWPAARSAARRLLELLLAVIASKLVIAIALAVGAAALGPGTRPLTDPNTGSPAAGGLGALIVGVAVLAMAAFAPFLVLRLFPVVEAAVIAQGLSRGPLRGVQSGASVAITASSVTRLAGGSARAMGRPNG